MDFDGRRITVMGLGRFGGGIGVTRWLCEQGAEVLVTDLLPEDQLAGSLAQLSDLIDAGRVTPRLGGHNVSDFTTCDVVIANPAVPRPWENRFLRAAEAAGIPVTTEIRLTVERLPNRRRTIGVTGTAGKSTTAAMVAHALGSLRWKACLGGNIGGSLLPRLHEIGDDDWVVLELSSAQLWWLNERSGNGWSPHVAVVTNFSPNHLDWHGGIDHYAQSKRSIVAHQSAEDACVVGDASARELVEGHADSLIIHAGGFDARLSLPGRHNRTNAGVAYSAVMRAAPEADEQAVRDALADFPGLPHRLQLAGELAGVRIFNDSKCTTPEACALAIGSFDEAGEVGARNVLLICGGYDKKIDLSPMIDAGARCAGVLTIGATGPLLADRVGGAGGHAEFCETLERAVEAAAGRARPGQVLLLSPGCASWDQFTNFEERGERFIGLATRLLGGAGSPS